MSKKRRAKIPPFRVLNSENIFRKFVSKIMRSCDKNFAQLQQEYQLFVDKVEKISNSFDISIICTLSIEGYVDIRKQFFEGIHIINDVVYQMSELERVKKFVQDHYPSGRKVSEKDVQNFCKEIMHKIGCDQYKLITRENVYLKLLNDSLVLRQKESEKLDKMELDFIMD